jgi:hypothetical protein
MPLTPLHFPIAYGIYVILKKWFPQNRNISLPGLIFGAFFPDTEIVAAYLLSFGNLYFRTVLHSLLGAATVGTFLTFLVVGLFYTPLIGSVFSIEKQEIKRQCSFSFGVFASCFLGNISHVLLDLVNHDLNTLLWPFIPLILSPISLALGGAQTASLIANTILGIAILVIFIQNRENLWPNLLVGKSEN